MTQDNPIVVESTKQCPICGNKYLGKMRQSNLKVCTDSNKHPHGGFVWIHWPLDEGQEPLV